MNWEENECFHGREQKLCRKQETYCQKYFLVQCILLIFYIYHLPTKLREGKVFSPVYLLVCSQGEGCMWSLQTSSNMFTWGSPLAPVPYPTHTEIHFPLPYPCGASILWPVRTCSLGRPPRATHPTPQTYLTLFTWGSRRLAVDWIVALTLRTFSVDRRPGCKDRTCRRISPSSPDWCCAPPCPTSRWQPWAPDQSGAFSYVWSVTGFDMPTL